MQHLISGCGLVLAAPSSGSGKTVLTLAILRALKRQRLFVRGAKAGPDFIDPAFHTIASGRSAINLDPWAMERDRVWSLASMGSGEALLIEAMMGLFDGAADGTGSAADLAVMLDVPVVMVIDCAKQSHSVAAVIRGFRDHRQDLLLSGIILNKVGSKRHEMMLRAAIEPLGMPVLGAVPRDERLQLPERHLGLVQAGEIAEINGFIDDAADVIERTIDLRALVQTFEALPRSESDRSTGIPPPGQHIAIARDGAFSFIYPHLLVDWRNAGAYIDFFSPLSDQSPTTDADAVFLPGGYPELHCATLANAENFKRGMKSAAERGVAVYGECGGYMVLGETLRDETGKDWPMTGLLKLHTSFADRTLHLGYRHLEGRSGWLQGYKLSAHEFHYTMALKEEGEPLFAVKDALSSDLGNQGLKSGSVTGSYMHLIDRAGA